MQIEHLSILEFMNQLKFKEWIMTIIYTHGFWPQYDPRNPRLMDPHLLIDKWAFNRGFKKKKVGY